jgi:hypothetical protein
MEKLLELFFTPSMAIARLGSSPEPVDSFRWTKSTTHRNAVDTRVVPAVSLKVEADGSVRPHMPDKISFKDANGAIRPVAPFFELWGRLQSADGKSYEVALSAARLQELGASIGDLRYEITLANLKAARRTGNPACSFIAREAFSGDDHEPRALLAISPHTADQEPLVLPDKPIPLGHLQIIRPVEEGAQSSDDSGDDMDFDVDCSVLRARYTPPRGYVYAPPTTINGPAPEVMPGVYEAAGIQFGRIHEIVPPERRILNPKTPWSDYLMMNGLWEDPTPQDGYDGGAVGSFRSWACVDDSCDGLLVATLAVAGRRHRAVARILVGPPDFAPDRRAVFSIAHDIADRELPPVKVDKSTFEQVKGEVLELFQRAFEHASLFNLDAARARALQENRLRFQRNHGPVGRDEPLAGDGSMTREDKPYIDKLPVLAPQDPSRFTSATEAVPLPYTTVVATIHAALKQEAVLMEFLKLRGDVVKRIVRPPFGRFGCFPEYPTVDANPLFRDPRVLRDRLHDMRMPPYIRDSGLHPLSLTWRQYHMLMAFIDYVQRPSKDEPEKAGSEPA